MRITELIGKRPISQNSIFAEVRLSGFIKKEDFEKIRAFMLEKQIVTVGGNYSDIDGWSIEVKEIKDESIRTTD